MWRFICAVVGNQVFHTGLQVLGIRGLICIFALLLRWIKLFKIGINISAFIIYRKLTWNHLTDITSAFYPTFSISLFLLSVLCSMLRLLKFAVILESLLRLLMPLRPPSSFPAEVFLKFLNLLAQHASGLSNVSLWRN